MLLSVGAFYRSISPAANLSAAVAAVDRRDRQTDERTDDRPFHRPCSAYYAGSVNELGLVAYTDYIYRGVYATQTMEQMHHEKIGGKVFAGT